MKKNEALEAGGGIAINHTGERTIRVTKDLVVPGEVVYELYGNPSYPSTREVFRGDDAQNFLNQQGQALDEWQPG